MAENYTIFTIIYKWKAELARLENETNKRHNWRYSDSKISNVSLSVWKDREGVLLYCVPGFFITVGIYSCQLS